MTSFLATLGAMAVLDGLWLGLVARNFYRQNLGGLMASPPRWAAALIFYAPLCRRGLVLRSPAGRIGGRHWSGCGAGAFLGLIAYATYDLTNLATLKDWSLKVTLVDIAWGTVMTAAVAAAATWLTLRIG